VQTEKAKLPKGMSYPLRASFLINALAAANLTIDTQLINAPSRIFLDAHFWPPNAAVPHERLYVRASAVLAQEASAAREYVESSVIPELIAWIQQLLSLPEQSPTRASQQYFRREWPRT
jgi:hypothetical protein